MPDDTQKDVSKPSDERIKEWTRRLRALTDEVETVYGEPHKGHYEDKLAILIRWAWETAWDEQMKRINAMSVSDA